MGLFVDLGSALAVALALAFAAVAAGRRLPDSGAGDRPWLIEHLTRIAGAVPVSHAVIAIGAAVGLTTAAGTFAVAADIDWRPIRINREQSVAAFLSGGLLMAGGALALVLAWERPERRLEWLLVGASMIVFGIDESAELHERIEVRTDLPAPVVVSPIAAVVGYGLWRNLSWLRANRPALELIVLGGASWVISQALDPFHAAYKSVVEEALEMVGSTLVLVAFLIILRRRDPGELRGDVGGPPG